MDARMNFKIKNQIIWGYFKDNPIRGVSLKKFATMGTIFSRIHRPMDIMVLSIGNFVTSKGIPHVCALEICIDGVICNAYFFQHGLCPG